MTDKGGKSDLERIGLFQEMSYVTTGDMYKTVVNTFNEAAGKGRQLLPGGSKEKSAQQHGYFADKFSRMFDGESYSDPIKIRRQFRLAESKKNISKAFLPSCGEKFRSGSGSHYGTLSGPIPAFSPVVDSQKLSKMPGKNIYTNPGKHGSGYGYVNVTLGAYPPHAVDPFGQTLHLMKKEMLTHKSATKGGAFRLNMHPQAFFDGNPFRLDKPLPPAVRSAMSAGTKDTKPFKPSSPGKMMGGSKIGTFDMYPSHSMDPYLVKPRNYFNIVNKSGKIFIPPTGPKSRPVHSIMHQNIDRSINCQNYRSMTLV